MDEKHSQDQTHEDNTVYYMVGDRWVPISDDLEIVSGNDQSPSHTQTTVANSTPFSESETPPQVTETTDLPVWFRVCALIQLLLDIMSRWSYGAEISESDRSDFIYYVAYRYIL